MRAAKSILAAGALAGVAAGAFAVTGRMAYADPAPAPILVHAEPEPPRPSEAERRAAFEAKLQARLRAGEFPRLTDAPAASPARAQPARRGADAPKAEADAPDRMGRVEPPSAIAPPAPAAGVRRTSSGRGYVPPVLDLKTPPRVPGSDVECLTQAIYYEARNESEEGQAAVAEVVLNRARSGRYPREVCAVVYQRNSRTCQFTFTCDGSIGARPVNSAAWARAERIAREALGGRKAAGLPDHALNYHANYVRPSWGKRLQRVRQIGAHIFYGAPLDGGAAPGQGAAPSPAPRGGLMFVRNEALERAYALAVGGAAPAPADEGPDGA